MDHLSLAVGFAVPHRMRRQFSGATARPTRQRHLSRASTQPERKATTMARTRNELLYRLEGSLTGGTPIGLVTDGLRADNTFSGTIVEGELRGAHVDGIDYFRVRADGVGIVNAKEIITLDDHSIAVDVHGYVLPPDGAPTPSLEEMASPGFVWPDAPLSIEAFATFETVSPAFQHLNQVTVVHTGTVNMATGELVINAWRPATAERQEAIPVYASYPG
jgi:hypothetical protein